MKRLPILPIVASLSLAILVGCGGSTAEPKPVPVEVKADGTAVYEINKNHAPAADVKKKR